MNTFSRWLLAATLMTGSLAMAQGDAYPSKPIQIVITSTPGSASDAITRVLGNEVTKTLGQPIVVISKASAAGTIGADFVKRSPPDGYTLFFGGNTTMAANVYLVKSLSYDPVRDFEPITLVSVNPLLLVVRSSLPVKTVAELVAYAKAHPGEMNYGVGNSGARVAAQLMMTGTGLKAQDISFNGASQAALELVAGRLDFMFVDPLVVDSFIQQGTLRPLAVSSSVRLPSMPNLPTMQEAGLKGYDYSSWLGYYAPRGTPKAIIDKLNGAFAQAIQSPEAQDYFRRMGMIGRSSAPDGLAAFNKDQITSWGRWVKEAGLQAQ
ncbi:Bug family tripartite tricarboxylate transporter substrate binding protein [Variovorax saccharolyticus]|uniref:Bug family tripartite tricarboxylate transporter substrate binding protein n=1 Tax=Variovorax saccharolyticus TaxID=3053516 RepID=UPI002578BB84|nr:tripartite tricarboxylate transporter substrate binding protein [Variovorax sp. J22R187]MDM0021828.1 tripartite tricarboxylate transporter substrate binding protein [Variovorax sp. J22R187]